MLGSAAGGKGLSTVANAGSSLYDFLKGQIGSGSGSNTSPDLPNSQDAAVNAMINQGYTLNPDTGYLEKDGVSYALDANNNPVEV
jgi:hypothetical protein